MRQEPREQGADRKSCCNTTKRDQRRACSHDQHGDRDEEWNNRVPAPEMSYALLYLCFADLTRLGDAMKRWTPVLIGLAGMMAAWHLFTRSIWIGSPVLFVSGTETESVTLWSAIPVAFVAIALLGRSVIQRARQT
jgi:hypothetical protein